MKNGNYSFIKEQKRIKVGYSNRVAATSFDDSVTWTRLIQKRFFFQTNFKRSYLLHGNI